MMSKQLQTAEVKFLQTAICLLKKLITEGVYISMLMVHYVGLILIAQRMEMYIMLNGQEFYTQRKTLRLWTNF